MIYTNKFVNFLSLIITSIIFFSSYLFIFKNNNNPINEMYGIISNIESEIEKNNKKENLHLKNSEQNNKKQGDYNTDLGNLDLGNWYIEIPIISLKAPIAEGTSLDILSKKIGHFEETAIELGNIGLAAHNRGYEFSFFKDLYKLKNGDEIIYTHEDFKKKYIVEKNIIIKNSDWNNLALSEDNKITLITCVENEPDYRRCVQAEEIEY